MFMTPFLMATEKKNEWKQWKHKVSYSPLA